jgi:hypothetical protein
MAEIKEHVSREVKGRKGPEGPFKPSFAPWVRMTRMTAKQPSDLARPST